MVTKEGLDALKAWSCDEGKLFSALKTSEKGLTEEESRKRHAAFGLNVLVEKKKDHVVLQYLSYFANPLILVLMTVAVASFFLDNKISAGIITLMVIVSGSLTFWQEYAAQDAAEKLRKMIRSTATLRRDGAEKEIPLKYIMPGDIVLLSAGDLVPADCRLLSCKDFHVNQSALTGESLPVWKSTKPCKENAQPSEMENAVFFGSSVVSGSATAVAVKTGLATQFGELALHLSAKNAETAFDRGVKEYSMLMIKFVIGLVLVIFLINAVLKQDVVGAILFALAVAVGLTPEMLPVIVTANLSQGANNMAKKQVIVKRLPSIQNLGAMDVLCTDKTGTLTEERIELVRHVNILGEEDEDVLHYAYLNSFHQTGLHNPLDHAVLVHDVHKLRRSLSGFRKIDEIPFDFVRRRMSVVVATPHGGHLMLTKGAPESMMPLCAQVSEGGKVREFGKKDVKKAEKLYQQLSGEGYRVLLLASKRIASSKKSYEPTDEKELCFEGFLSFFDPPKKTAQASLFELQKRGIEVKILSGDNELVNEKIASEVGLHVKGVITGVEISRASAEALKVLVEKNTIFARVSPMQKERIIIALQHNRHVVGYLGDGINDAPALKIADVGISVDTAVDIAKESASIILLRKSLRVLYEGVDEGRRTFMNTMKYLKMGSSSNFGNMFSVVGASLFLPFLPMMPIQIIFNNFLYDMSQLGIPADNVDADTLSKPAQWNLGEVRNFMLFIGPVSSLFDYLTFGVMWFVFGAATIGSQGVFQAGWFIESLASQTLVIHVIRTNKIPFVQSWPSMKLLLLSIAIVAAGLLVVATPIGHYFGFGTLPDGFYPMLGGIVIAYLLLTQIVKMALLKYGMIK